VAPRGRILFVDALLKLALRTVYTHIVMVQWCAQYCKAHRSLVDALQYEYNLSHDSVINGACR
jgi:hypothetical protein